MEKVNESIKLHYCRFVDFHGDELVTFPDGYSMAAAVQKQHRLEYEMNSKKDIKEVQEKFNLKNPWPTYSYPEEVLKSKRGIGVFFNQNEGQEIMLEFNNITRGFEKKGIDLTYDEMDNIRDFIESKSISCNFVEKVTKKYGSESVAKAYFFKDLQGMDCLKFVLRKYKGEYFRIRYPNLTII